MRVLLLLLTFFSSSLWAKSEIFVFVSFSMPSQLLEETAKDAARHDVPLVLNGFHHNSMQETAVKIFELTKKIPTLSIQIDPTAFEEYDIKQVPAWVQKKSKNYDVVYGNITFEKAVNEFNSHGNTRSSND